MSKSQLDILGKHFPVIVIGGGQAGLSVSYCLRAKKIDHIIFDRGNVADSWKSRWDNFTLVTPNWQCELPGYKYQGDDPDGFMCREQVVDFVSKYAASFDPPLQSNVEVKSLEKTATHFDVETTVGPFTADVVVIATGAYNIPVIPAIVDQFEPDVQHFHSSDYRNAGDLPPGEVMVVGSGQSGCQIAEDLHLEGRKVHLCVGDAPRSPRRYRGKDVVAWLDAMNYYDQSIDSFPDPVATRNKVNHYVTGRDGGREIDLRAFAQEGMQLYGRLASAEGNKAFFSDNLKQDLDRADQAAQGIKDRIDQYIQKEGLSVPTEPKYQPVWEPQEAIQSIDLKQKNITSIIWCIGYRADYSWIDLPILDSTGYPMHTRGVSTCSGVYFIGLPWMYTWGSGRFSGLTQDAQFVTDRIEEQVAVNC
ncbi:MAG: MSMEG_0569 family flavin-dependent oxidoreductase [Bacteroidota bacterium]